MLIYQCTNEKCRLIWSEVATTRKIRGKKGKPPHYFVAQGKCPDCIRMERR